MKVDRYIKAILASLVASLAVLELALEDDFVSGTEWVRVVAAFLVALGIVYAVPNVPPPWPPSDDVPKVNSGGSGF